MKIGDCLYAAARGWQTYFELSSIRLPLRTAPPRNTYPGVSLSGIVAHATMIGFDFDSEISSRYCAAIADGAEFAGRTGLDAASAPVAGAGRAPSKAVTATETATKSSTPTRRAHSAEVIHRVSTPPA